MNTFMFGVIDATVAYDDLKKLIIHRLPSALQFGGRYRLIDFALSNMKNSGIRNVSIFPNGNYRSLTDHIASGKIWDLDRKKDGLFVLPPKKIIELSDEVISFNRMKEHMEYFIRSRQEYLVLTSGVIVWNIDFSEPLKSHIDSDCDITEVLYKNQKLNTYILKKEYLIQLILQHEYLGYKNINEVIKFGNNIKVNYYYHNGYTKMIKTINDFYDTNMDMLNFDVGRTIFKNERPILSKSKDSTPTFYGEKASVSNTLIADGAEIHGCVNNSVIFRDCFIDEGVKINDSIIMQSAKVQSNAILEHCILDKRCIIGENVVLRGTKESPIIIEKDEKIISKAQMCILHVASECAPFIKTGGLADVIGALPKKQRSLGIETICCLPLYRQIDEIYMDLLSLEYTYSIEIDQKNLKVKAYNIKRDGVDYYFLDINNYFDRDKLYGYEDDLIRYYAFNIGVLELINQFKITPNIIHVHDYHPSLIPALLNNRYHSINKFSQIKTMLTIHNLKYQGIYDNPVFIKNNLNDITSSPVNFLKIGLEHAHKITTVSKTYSKEIQFDYFSENLKSVIVKRKKDLYGILNGLDYEVYNPKQDIFIYQNYDVHSIEKKKANKKYLQYTLNLPNNEEVPIISMVTRLVEQKGLDLVISVFNELMKEIDFQFVLLGTGDKSYEDALKKLEAIYKDRVRINIGYDSFNPNQIYAGSDLFLMPSRFEPCGLSQMIALKYGTIPIVRETGGLNDTINPYNEFTKSGNGFSFTNYNAHDMKHTIKRAINFYKQKEHWSIIMKSAMECDFSYEKTATKYFNIYESMMK